LDDWFAALVHTSVYPPTGETNSLERGPSFACWLSLLAERHKVAAGHVFVAGAYRGHNAHRGNSHG
jgi:hypothetical protein